MVRIKPNLKSMGIHLSTYYDVGLGRVQKATNDFELHYDCCNFMEWQTKWQRRYDGTAVIENMRDDRKKQFEDYAAAVESGSKKRLEQLFRREYSASAYH